MQLILAFFAALFIFNVSGLSVFVIEFVIVILIPLLILISISIGYTFVVGGSFVPQDDMQR